VKIAPANRLVAASLAETIADELAAVAHTHRQNSQTETAKALLVKARDHRVQAIRLRALAGGEQYMSDARRACRKL
jgi:hypothetical protein